MRKRLVPVLGAFGKLKATLPVLSAVAAMDATGLSKPVEETVDSLTVYAAFGVRASADVAQNRVATAPSKQIVFIWFFIVVLLF